MREQVESLNTYLWIVLHHRWIALASAILICISGWSWTAFIPDIYKVEAKVFLDSKTILGPLLKGLAVENTIKQEEAMIMRKTLLTRQNLLKVIRAVDLDLQAKNNRELEIIIKNLKEDIRIDSVNIEGIRKGKGNIFSISYLSEVPDTAKKVVETLLNIFVESILGKSRIGGDKAEEFIENQIKQYQDKLEEVEGKLKLFKQTYAGLMPRESSSYYSRLNKLEDNFEDAQMLLKEKMNQSVELKRQINTLIQNQSNYEQTILMESTSPISKRIENIQIKLDDLLLQYTDKHPDVIANRRILNELEIKRNEEIKNKITNENSNNSEIIKSTLFQELNIMHGQAKAEVAAIKARVESYGAKIVEMESIINDVPKVEAELAILNRDYAVIKKTYEELLQRGASAKMSREADQSSSQSQFNIIEPPVIPQKPESPNRLLLITLVLVFGISGGVVIAILYEQIIPTFYTEAQVEEEYDIPVIGCLTMNWSDSGLKERYNGLIVFSIVSLILVFAYIVILLKYIDPTLIPVKIPFLN